MDRRDFFKTAGLAGATLLLNGTRSEAQAREKVYAFQPNPYAPSDFRGLSQNPEAYTFLSSIEAKFIEAACERVLPTDASGPGALACGVSYYIDQQLQGSFGQAGRWYMQGPWSKGTPEQGYQLALTPAEVYRAGIAATNRFVQRKYGKTFDALNAAHQDEILKAVEAGQVSDDQASRDVVTQFFAFLIQNTVEGFFADPAYGGNRNKAGWRQIGYPGVYLELYGDYIDKASQKIRNIKYLSLADAQRNSSTGS